MRKYTCTRLCTARYVILLVASLSTGIVIVQSLSDPWFGAPASAHFFGIPYLENKTVGNYKVVFQPSPTVPVAGSNSTQLNLSILDKEDQNVVLVFTSLLIKEKESGKVVKTFPFAFHDFSDVTFPFAFEKSGTYVITLLTRINGDPVYSSNPLTVDFDLPVVSATKTLPLDQLLLYYVIPGIVAIAVIALYLRKKNKI
jgi:hypothetical protein